MTLDTDRHQTLAELLPAYSLGALEGKELAGVEEHLRSGCEACEAELAEWNRLGDRLADTVTPVQPSETTRARVLAGARTGTATGTATSAASGSTPAVPPIAADRRDSSAPPAARTRSLPGWLALAASLAALAIASWSAVRQGGLSQELAVAQEERVRLIREQNDLRGSVAQARGRLQELSSSMELVSSPATRRIALVGLGSAETADGTALVDTRTDSARVTARGLTELPEDRTYQLWYITADDGPVSAGVFTADPTGRAAVDVVDVPFDRVQLWAVTIEPAGGVPQPTGEMILKS